MSYKKAVQLINYRYEYGDPDGALLQALEELDKVRVSKRDAEWHHLRGYCYYEMEDPEEAGPEFRRALELQSDHPWANLYLGHVLFDEDEYAQALVHFLRTDEGLFRKLGQVWRVLKNQELVLCCQIYTQPRLPALAGLDRLIELYASRPLDAPVPLEIVLCVDKLVWSGRLKGKVLMKWTDRIDDLVSNLVLAH